MNGQRYTSCPLRAGGGSQDLLLAGLEGFVWLPTHRDFTDVAGLDTGIANPGRDLSNHDFAQFFHTLADDLGRMRRLHVPAGRGNDVEFCGAGNPDIGCRTPEAAIILGRRPQGAAGRGVRSALRFRRPIAPGVL